MSNDKKGPTSILGALRLGVSSIMSRARLASAAGMSFGGKRDLYTALGYTRELTVDDYRKRFKRNAIASRVVTALPKATWRGGGELIEDDDPEVETEFEIAWADFAKRLKMWPVMQRTDVLAGLGRYAVILIGAPGDLEDEMPRGASLDEIAYLTPYAEDDAKVDTLDTNDESPRYGMPQTYSVKRINADTSRAYKGAAAGKGATVHHSRIIHVADNLLDDGIYGTPRLENIWNNLDDLDKVIGGGSEAFWLRAHPGYHLDLDKEVEMEPDDEAALSDEVDEFEHGFRRMVRTRGMKMTPLDAQVADIAKPSDAIVSIISAGTGIPKRILMGSERGELSSTQDKNNWDQRVNDRRTEFAEPFMVGALVDRMIEYGYSPEAIERSVRWPQKQDLDAQEKGALGKTWASINKEMGDIVVTPDEIRDHVLGLPPLEDVVDEADLEEMRNRNKPAAPVMPGDEVDENGEPIAPGAGRIPADDEDEDDDEETGRAASRVGAGARSGRRLVAPDAARDLVSNYRHAKRAR